MLLTFLIVKFCTGTPGNKCSGATEIGVSSSQVIPDSKMTASSQQSDLTKPSYGRLNGVRGNGWCAGTARTRMTGYRWILEEQSKSVHCPPREKLMAIDGLQISSSATQQMEFHGDIT